MHIESIWTEPKPISSCKLKVLYIDKHAKQHQEHITIIHYSSVVVYHTDVAISVLQQYAACKNPEAFKYLVTLYLSSFKDRRLSGIRKKNFILEH